MTHAHEHAGVCACGDDGKECTCNDHGEQKQTAAQCSKTGEGECHCHDDTLSKPSFGAKVTSYRALIIVLLGVFAFAAFAMWTTGYIEWHVYMQYFMAGYFLAFGILQTLSLKKSARMLQQYDVIAKRLPLYAYVYPLLQIALGVGYLYWFSPIIVNSVAAVILFFTLIGVVNVLEQKQQVRCGCLGETMNVKVGWVTLLENAGMFVMVVGMLVYFFATLEPANSALPSEPSSGHHHQSL